MVKVVALVSSGPEGDIKRIDNGIVHSVISRITRHGLPAANTPSGISLVTTLPAPITARDPIRTSGRMIAPPPTQTSCSLLQSMIDFFAQQSEVYRLGQQSGR